MTPVDLDAEQQTIGALIIDRWCVDRVRDLLGPADFAHHTNEVLYRALTHPDSRIERRYLIIDGQLTPAIPGLAQSLRTIGITDPRPYVAFAQWCADTTLGWRHELADRLDTVRQARAEIAALHARLEEIGAR